MSNNEINWTLFCIGCGECCCCVPLKPKDWQRLKSRIQRPCDPVDYMQNTILPWTESKVCVFLTNEKRCAIYEDRPNVCRLFGTILALRCSYAHPEWPESVTMSQYVNIFRKQGISAIL